MKKKRKMKGFTLIEMLIVIGIIAILILLFVPKLSQHQKSASETGNAAVVRVVKTQIELYKLETDDAEAQVNEALLDQMEAKQYITAKQKRIYWEHKDDPEK